MHYYKHVDPPLAGHQAGGHYGKRGNGVMLGNSASFGSGIGEIPLSSLNALQAQGLGGVEMVNNLGDWKDYLPVAGKLLQQGPPTTSEEAAKLLVSAGAAAGAVEVARMSPNDRFLLLKNMPENQRNVLLRELPLALRQEFLNRLNPQDRARIASQIGVRLQSRGDLLKWGLIAAGIGIGAIILVKSMGKKKSVVEE